MEFRKRELQTQCAATIRLESGSPALWSQHGDCQSFEQFGLGSSHKMHKGNFILQYLLYSLSIFSISQPSLKEKALNLKKKMKHQSTQICTVGAMKEYD